MMNKMEEQLGAFSTCSSYQSLHNAFTLTFFIFRIFIHDFLLFLQSQMYL